MDRDEKIQRIIEEGRRCQPRTCIVTGPTGPTARCNKSSIYFFKW